MKRHPLSTLLSSALIIGLAASALAAPAPPKPPKPPKPPRPPSSNNQAALLQQSAIAAQQHLLIQRNAAAQQHLLLAAHTAAAQQQLLLHHAANSAQLLRVHAATSQQQLLLKAHENFSKLHLLEQARRPERLAAIGGTGDEDAPVTRITRERD